MAEINLQGLRKKDYIIFSHLISLILMGLMFVKNIFDNTLNYYFYNSFMFLLFFAILYFMVKYLKKKIDKDIPAVDNCIMFITYVTLITVLIYYNPNFNRHFLKIYYIIPIVLYTVNSGRVFSFFAWVFSGFNIILLNYLLQDFSYFEIDIIIIIIFFWVGWLIGVFKDFETRARERLEKNLNKSRELADELDKTNRELRRSQELFRLNFDESHIGMAICDTEGRFVKVNRALSGMLGYSPREMVGQNALYFLYPDELNNFRNIYRSMLKSKKSTGNYVKRYLNRDGDTVWFKHNITLVRDDEQEPLYFLNQMEDITEKKLAEEKIKRQQEQLEYNKLRTNFFAKVSHELKTPLNLIFSSLQILKMKHKKCLPDDRKEEVTKYTKLIKQNSYRLLRLVNNVIDLTKLNTNFFNINLGNYDIVSIVKNITFSTEDYIINKNKILEFNSEMKEKIVACDPFNLERIILNLLSNAVKFTEEGDKISVDIYEEADNIVIVVKDTGIGIKKDKQELIFEQFRQVDESFNRSNEGSGIGLSIVKSLVELHSGQVRVESEYGKGTEFIIEIPAVTVSEAENKREYVPDNLIDKINIEFSDIY